MNAQVEGINIYSSRQVAELTGANIGYVRYMAQHGRIGIRIDSFYVYTDTCLATVRARRRAGVWAPRKDGRIKCANCGKMRNPAQTIPRADGEDRPVCSECATTPIPEKVVANGS